MLLNIIRIRQNNSDSAGLGSGRIWIDQYETKFEYLPELVSHVTDTLLAPCYWHPPCAMFRTSSLRHVTDSLPSHGECLTVPDFKLGFLFPSDLLLVAQLSMTRRGVQTLSVILSILVGVIQYVKRCNWSHLTVLQIRTLFSESESGLKTWSCCRGKFFACPALIPSSI